MFSVLASVLAWFVVVTVMGQEVQKSDPMSQEECIEFRDKYRAYVMLVSQGTGLVKFREHIVKLSDIEIECVRDTKGDA